MVDSKDAVPNSVLLVGDEPDLVYRALSERISELEGLNGGRPERLTFQAGECAIEEVIVSWSQSFIFASHAVVVLRDPSKLLADDVEKLVSALEGYGGANYLFLANFSGTVPSVLRSYFSKRGRLVDTSLKRGARPLYLKDLVRRSGLKMDARAALLLESHLGEDVVRVSAILDLLKARLGEGARVASEDIVPYLSEPGDTVPWKFTDAIESGNTALALELLSRLSGAGDRHPLAILAILQSRVIELSVLSGESIHNLREAAEALRGRNNKSSKSDFVIEKMFKLAKALGYDRLSRAVVLLSRADRAIKGEGGLFPEIVMEILVVKLTGLFGRSSVGRTR